MIGTGVLHLNVHGVDGEGQMRHRKIGPGLRGLGSIRPPKFVPRKRVVNGQGITGTTHMQSAI